MKTADKQSLLSWVEGAFALGETLAVGGQLGDGTPFYHTATREFSACMADDVWKVIGTALGAVAAARPLPISAMWVFENGTLWLASRADGAWLGVFTERGLDERSTTAVRTRLQEFAQLA